MEGGHAEEVGERKRSAIGGSRSEKRSAHLRKRCRKGGYRAARLDALAGR